MDREEVRAVVKATWHQLPLALFLSLSYSHPLNIAPPPTFTIKASVHNEEHVSPAQRRLSGRNGTLFLRIESSSSLNP